MVGDMRGHSAKGAALRGPRTRVCAGLAAALGLLTVSELRATRGCLAKWNIATAGAFVSPQECGGSSEGHLGSPSAGWVVAGSPTWSAHAGLRPLEHLAVAVLVVTTASVLAHMFMDLSSNTKASKPRRRQSQGFPQHGDLVKARPDPVRDPVRELEAGGYSAEEPEKPPLKLPIRCCQAPVPAPAGKQRLPEVLQAPGSVVRVPPDAALAASLRNGHLAATFERVEVLAAGGFGLVCRALHKLEGVWYAIKLVPIRGLAADEDVGSRPELREVRSLKALADSRHVVRYHTAWCEEPCCLQGAFASQGAPGAQLPPGLFGGDEAMMTRSSSCSKQASTRPVSSVPSLTTESSLGFVWQDSLPDEADCSGAERGEARAAAPVGQSQAHTVVLLMQMELCDGATLRTWLDSDARGRAPLSFAWADEEEGLPLELQFAEHLAKACREIHRAGLVHRDLKPSNVFVVRDKVLKVGDFGLARPASESPWASEEQGIVGTPAYCAPEGGARATAASDVFSMALVILELLCPPMRTKMESAKVFEAFRERGTLPRHIEESLPGHAELLRRMGSPSPEDRPTAGEAYATLKALRPAGLALQRQRKLQAPPAEP